MSAASGLEHLKPFLPGLENALEDSEVSEIMINGPGNVWIERAGRLAAYEAPNLDEAALLRAAIHIARPLGLDPASSPIVDARLDDGSRVAICVPPASPQVAITVRRFGKRSFSADDLVKLGSLPEAVKKEAERVLRFRRNILVSGGTGSGKTTLLNALIELLPDDDPRFSPPRAASPPGSHRRGRGSWRGGGGPAASPQYRTRRVADDRTRQQRRERLIPNRQLRHARRRGASLGSHLSRGGGRHRPGDSHDAPRGSAVRGGSLVRQGLRSRRESLGYSASLATA